MEENGNVAAYESEQSLGRSSSIVEISDSLKDISFNGNNESDDENFSAPFEILSEFLSTLLTRDYKNAFHYCKLILQYEPENVTVQEFYPLIEQKIKIEAEISSSEESSESLDSSGKVETEESTEYYSSDEAEENEDPDLSTGTANSDLEEDSRK